MRRVGVTVSLLLVGLLTCVWAQAGDSNVKYFQKQFERFSKVIADLKEADVTEEAAQDIEMIRTWIGQAQAFLASDRLDDIEAILKRIESQAEYVRAKINRKAAEDEAEDAEQLAKSAEEKAQKARNGADDAARKMKALEAKGL